MGSLSAKGVLGWDGESCQPISNGWETHPSTGNVPPCQYGGVLLRQKAQRPVVLMTCWLSVCLFDIL